MKKKRTSARRVPQRSESLLSQELETLRKFQLATFGLARETEIRALLDRVLAAVIELTEANFGNMQLADPFTGELQIIAQRGFDLAFVGFFNDTRSASGACSKAATIRERVIVRDVKTEPIFRSGASREIMLRAGVHACQSTPLFASSGDLLGILSTHYRVPRMPPSRGLRLLDLLAREASALIERTLYRERLESIVAERTRELHEKNLVLQKQTETVHEISAHLLEAQDMERRRIARDLHDTTAQEIGSIAVSLGYLSSKWASKSDGTDPEARKVIAENADLARQVLEELRTLSDLLHPPLLDDFGLRSAIIWYTEGFEKRSGIRVEIACTEDFPRLAQNVETALFRVVQEALTNVYRYSGSRTARIELDAVDGMVQLAIEDRGKGMKVPVTEDHPHGLGVGIPGMRERIRQFGGTLTIVSSHKGTRVVATLALNSALPSETTKAKSQQEMISKPPVQESRTGAKRILIVDDHEVVHAGIRAMVQSESDLEICGDATTGSEGIGKAVELRPDLILLDLSLPDMGGLRVTSELHKKHIASKILVLTMHPASVLSSQVKSSGCCHGFVQKGAKSAEFLEAIRTVLSGGTYFPRKGREARWKAHQRFDTTSGSP